MINDPPAEENSYNSNTSVKYLKLKGRSGKKSSKINNPPKDQPWIWLTSELICSLAWRSMSINCQKLVNRLIIEHRNHGGYENGHLVCTYKDFVDYGLTRNNIRPAIEEAQALGLVKHQRGERVFAKNQPNSYTLTFYATENKYSPTNDWKKLTEERLISFKHKIKLQRRKRAEFKQRSRM
tara:strand:+ start:161 stop:703 length:543 start_codon:yes stop_codon:yes gene_type:complete